MQKFVVVKSVPLDPNIVFPLSPLTLNLRIILTTDLALKDDQQSFCLATKTTPFTGIFLSPLTAMKLNYVFCNNIIITFI